MKEYRYQVQYKDGFDLRPYEQDPEWKSNQRQLPSKARTSGSRRVDMAAMINTYNNDYDNNTGGGESFEMPKHKFFEQYSETLDESKDSQEEDAASEYGPCCVLSRPCLCTSLFLFFAIVAVFAAGLGTGLATRPKVAASVNGISSTDTTTTTTTTTATTPPGSDENQKPSNGNVPTSIAPSPPTASPSPTDLQPTIPTETLRPTPQIVFDVDIDFDSDSPFEDEEDDAQDPDYNNDFEDGGNNAQDQNNNDGNQGGGGGGGNNNANPPDNSNNNSGNDNPTNGNDNPQDQNPPANNSGNGSGNGDAPSSFTPLFVGVYYYPWHGNNFHNREGYLRKELQPRHRPVLGEYDDSQPQVISQHLSWSRQANVGLWVTSWWGPGRTEDLNTLRILNHSELGNMKIALHYETSGRIGLSNSNILTAESDMSYICDNYFSHPNYYRTVDGRPVIFIYLTRVLENSGGLAAVSLTMRNAVAEFCGEDVFLVGDHAFGNAPSIDSIFETSYYMDAITNYDVYGAMGRPESHYAGRQAVDDYIQDQNQWKTIANAHDCRYIPAIAPGYNDRGVRLESGHPALSRRLTANSEEGSLFAYQIEKSRRLVDLDNLIMVNSFNEWHEDTQIEPAEGDTTTEPSLYTNGVEYSGYNDMYLNILRMGTLEGRSDMFNYNL